MTFEDRWLPATSEIYRVEGTMGGVMVAVESTGEQVRLVAFRVASVRNGDETEDDRTFALDLDMTVAVITGLISVGSEAFGRGTMMTAHADALGVSPAERDRAIAMFEWLRERDE